jgi:hypothetical protein
MRVAIASKSSHDSDAFFAAIAANPRHERIAMPSTDRPTWPEFYRDVFLPEHRHPVNRALHIAGTLGGLAYAAWVFTLPAWPWWLVLALFPVVHAAPGLLGHRLFERNADVGDARWRRADYPAWWFIVGNHRMTGEWLLGRSRTRRADERAQGAAPAPSPHRSSR